MEGFTRINNTLINTKRLLIVEHKQESSEQSSRAEHYRAVFDTGQILILTPEEGRALMPASVAHETIGG